ncbi:hypothetical protein [Cumulibacter soli]|nr:hypothetical protein [Cumulibacter soli]
MTILRVGRSDYCVTLVEIGKHRRRTPMAIFSVLGADVLESDDP